MPYLIFGVVVAIVLITIVHFRHRPPRDPTKSVGEFERAIKALRPSPTKAVRRSNRKVQPH